MPDFRQKFDAINTKLQQKLGDAAVWVQTHPDGSVATTHDVVGFYSSAWANAEVAGFNPHLTGPAFVGLESELAGATEGDLLRYDGKEYVMQEPQPSGEGDLLIPLRHIRELADG